MASPLRILMTADAELPVPPRLYGGIERVIALLADGLSSRGHDVTLVAHRSSRIGGRVVPYRRVKSTGLSAVSNAAVVMRTAATVRPDVVHSFGRLATLSAILPTRVPKVMSYQRAVTATSVRWGRRLAGRSLTFVSCSRRLVHEFDESFGWRVVHNAVDVGRFVFTPEVASDAPFVFLGRIEAIKGVHVAIEVARRARRRLVIAGNVSPGHQAYFDQAVRPHLTGGGIAYVGAVDDRSKSELLSQSAALLMPVLWEEPFGIVMAEALACGTPVIGFGRGAVPEIVDHGVTGFVCRNEREMDVAVCAVGELSRSACRTAAETRFSQQALVDGYERVYAEAIRGLSDRARVAQDPVLARRRD